MFSNLYRVTEFNTSTLAFNINVHYYNQEQIIKINKVYVKNYPKYFGNITFLNKIFVYKKNIFNYIYKDVNFNKFLYKVNLCGFLNYTQRLNIDTNNYVFLDIKTNPIVKSIKVFSSKNTQLLIPRQLVFNQFKRQLGLPKNYNLIYKTINNINLWYQYNGFIWSDIKLLNENLLNNISIKIDQGNIEKIKLICQSTYKINKDFIDQTNLLVKQELNLCPGNILNLHYLQKGIDKLKKYNIMSSCYYSIKKSDNGLLIRIEYCPSNQLFIHYSKNHQLSDYFFLPCQKIIVRFIRSEDYINFFNFYYPYNLHMFAFVSSLLNYKNYISIECSEHIYKFFGKINLNYSFTRKNFYFFKQLTNKLKIHYIHNLLWTSIFQIENKNLLNFNGYSKFKLCRNILNKFYVFYIKTKSSLYHYIFSKVWLLEINYINCFFHYQIATNNTLKYLLRYYNFWIYSSLCIYMPNYISNYSYGLVVFYKQIHIKYHHIINIPISVANIQKHYLNFSSNVYIMIGEKKNLYVNSSHPNMFPIKYISILNFSYNTSFIQYTWIYCFTNIFAYHNISLSSFISLPSAQFSKIFLTSYIGLGIQLDSFIKFIPPIRIEFICNNITYNTLHIYTHYTYNIY